MLKSKMILTVLVALGLLAGTSYAEVTPGAVLEFNAANNPGEAGGEFTNQGSLGGVLPAFNAYGGYSGLPPVAVADGPGPLLDRSYDNVDINGDATCWAGAITAFATQQLSTETWVKARSFGAEVYLHSLKDTGGPQYHEWTFLMDSPDALDLPLQGHGWVVDLVGPIPVDEWAHVVVTLDVETDVLNAYLDGVQITTDLPVPDAVLGSVFNWIGVAAGVYDPASAQAPGTRFD